MKDDYISKQDAKDALQEKVFHNLTDEFYGVMQVLDELPPAQPERKNGRWIPVDSYSAFGGDEATWMAHGNPVAFYYCSECKEQAYAGEDGESLLTAYCPKCGAKMDGGNEA